MPHAVIFAMLFALQLCHTSTVPYIQWMTCVHHTLNAAGFDFGECQTGERVDHVILPPWAKEDPRLFVLKHRQVYMHLRIYHVMVRSCSGNFVRDNFSLVLQ